MKIGRINIFRKMKLNILGYNYIPHGKYPLTITLPVLQERAMLLKKSSSDHMVEVLNIVDLMNPILDEVVGQYQEGEEQQDPEKFRKSDLVFLSGENLPRCWTDPHYRDNEIRR